MLTGYLNGFSAMPGQVLSAHMSADPNGPVRARLVRIHCGDPNPAFGGLHMEDLSAVFASEVIVGPEVVRAGSMISVPLPEAVAAKLLQPFTLAARIRRSAPAMTDEVVLALDGESNGGPVVHLGVGRNGAFVQIGDARLEVGVPLTCGPWWLVTAGVQPLDGRIALSQTPVGSDRQTTTIVGTHLVPALASVRLMSVAATAQRRLCFSGRIEDPAIFEGLPDATTADFQVGGAPVIVGLDLSRSIGTLSAADIGPHALTGTCHNLPLQAVRGSRWMGREMCWRHAPREYAAWHFHADDLHDCGWPAQISLTVPAGLESGLYGLAVDGAAGSDILPFVVRPPQGAIAARAGRIAMLVPTFTYMAYANNVERHLDLRLPTRQAVWSPGTADPVDHPAYGRSTYNHHADGSGIALSSGLRPILNLRPGYLAAMDDHGSGVRHFPADTLIADWLRETHGEVDFLTDHDLDDEGFAAVQGYGALVTGTHPEYHTETTWQALSAFLRDGGRLLYAGANGFYWRIGRTPLVPGVIEVRRAEGGVRNWAAEPGEAHHALDGQPGGLLERVGRPSRDLVGTTFSAQGPYVGTVYSRSQAPVPPELAAEVAALLDGVMADTWGADAAWGGGAAGFETDRVTLPDADWQAAILATTGPLGPPFEVPYEELMAPGLTASGEALTAIPRGDLALIRNPAGGLVLSGGSLLLVGALARGRRDGPIPRVLANFLRRVANTATTDGGTA